jgi:capsule polysaccharide modification protein KpsS
MNAWAPRGSSFEALVGRRLLLLQGPAGPFFRRLGRLLEARGASVTKVNFNAGDDLFYRGGQIVRFRGRSDRWPDFFRELAQRREIEAVVMFGDLRPLHRAAVLVSRELGLQVFVVDEGYLRPDFVTLERGGVLGRSSMPKDPDYYRALEPSPLPEPRRVGDVMTPAALYTIAYAVTHAAFGWRYPHYRHHRDIRLAPQTLCWVRGGLRRVVHSLRDRRIDARIASGFFPPFFLVPLQVHLDAAVKDSDFSDIEDFIEVVVRSFAEHAPADSLLLVKDHPMGRPYRNYSEPIARLRERFELGERLLYVDVIHLPTALRNAAGTVVINSTVGLSSLHHGTPVKCLGRAVYDMPCLTFQGTLDAFWKQPGDVDADLYERFRWWLRTENQINGSVWKRVWP